MSVNIKDSLLKTAEKLDLLADSLEKIDKVEKYTSIQFEKQASTQHLSLGSVGDKPVAGVNPMLDFLIGQVTNNFKDRRSSNMSYDIVKGWPAPGALDVNLTPATGTTLVGGEVITINASGEAILATFDSVGVNAESMAFFTVGTDNLNGGVSAIKSGMVIEVDADHYDADTYAIGDALSANVGKFCLVDTSAKQVGIILAYNATTGVMSIVWTAVA